MKATNLKFNLACRQAGKIKNLKLKIKDTSGQLLIELLISLFVGGMFLLGATLGITSVLRYSFETRGNQAASGYANDILNQTQLLASSNWHNMYDLSKGSTYHYFLNQRGAATVVIPGTESVLYNDVTSGLVGQWKLDEDIGTTTYDTSGKGNDASMATALTRLSSTNCIAGSCVMFSGASNNYAIVLTTTTLDLAKSITFSAWIYPTSHAAYAPILGKVPSGFGAGYEFADSSGSLRTTLRTGSGNCDYSGGTLTLNTWQQVISTYDGTNIRHYINGSLVGTSASCTYGAATTTANLYLGGRVADSARFTGSIDDIRIYNHVLNANEVKDLFESPIYNRYFFVENTNRDSSLNIASTGGTNDPSTQKVTVGVTWEGGRQLQLYHYFMRDGVFILHNNNWGGGFGNTGTTTEATSTFATSSNILVSAVGQISLATTSVSGWLESATMDTQVSQGASINSVLWQGTQPLGTNVMFQIAMSNNSTGPWGYAGYDGSGSTYFSPASPNVSVDVENFHNYRYFRYKLFLNPSGGTGPTVMDALVNWSK